MPVHIAPVSFVQTYEDMALAPGDRYPSWMSMLTVTFWPLGIAMRVLLEAMAAWLRDMTNFTGNAPMLLISITLGSQKLLESSNVQPQEASASVTESLDPEGN